MVMPRHEDKSGFQYGKGFFPKFLQLNDLQFCSVSSNRLSPKSSDRNTYIGDGGPYLSWCVSVSSILYYLVCKRGR